MEKQTKYNFYPYKESAPLFNITCRRDAYDFIFHTRNNFDCRMVQIPHCFLQAWNYEESFILLGIYYLDRGYGAIIPESLKFISYALSLRFATVQDYFLDLIKLKYINLQECSFREGVKVAKIADKTHRCIIDEFKDTDYITDEWVRYPGKEYFSCGEYAYYNNFEDSEQARQLQSEAVILNMNEAMTRFLFIENFYKGTKK